MNPTLPRRVSTLLIATAALVAVAFPAWAADTPQADGLGPFVDTDGSVFENAVTAVWHAAITNGCEEWRFCPDASVTREETAAFLTRALDLPLTGVLTFVDTGQSQFQREIEAIAAAGITEGCGSGMFCPDDPVTRAQLASFLVRALDLPPSVDDPFNDDEASVHEADIAAIGAAGITVGCGEGRYCPADPVTRAELATFLARALDLELPSELPEIPVDARNAYLAETAAVAWPTGPGAEGWRPLVEQHFHPADVDRAIRVIACESHGDPNARNRSSGASGLFQHIPRYWAERSGAAGFGGHSIYDPVANVAVAAWLIYDYPGGGWKHWVCKG